MTLDPDLARPQAYDDVTLAEIRGKNSVGHATIHDVQKLFQHIDALEALLDEDDHDDVHGTEGWRHHMGIDE